MEDFLNLMVPDNDHSFPEISTLVFMDLEATGLPSLVGRKNVQITEISLVAVDRHDFETDSTFRVLNKLSLCVRPRATISPTAMEITGLYNDVLEKQEKFDESIPKLLEHFFRRLRRPLCLLAHNGRRYDFPLLQAELQHINYTLDPKILCADTLEAFRSIVSNAKTDLTFITSNPILESSKHNPENLNTADNGHSTKLDDETDKLLSENMDIFKDIIEPAESIVPKCISLLHVTTSWTNKPEVIGCNSASKVNPHIDERTPPKSSLDNQSMPKLNLHKKQQDLSRLPNSQYKASISSNLELKPAKRQLFATETPPNKKCASVVSKPVQFSLDKLYMHYFGQEPPQSHYAEADCITLSKVCQQINGDFLQWIDENCLSFSDIKAMW